MDLTLVFGIAAAGILALAVVLWIKHNKDKKNPAPPPADAEKEALQAALKQAIDKLHESVPAPAATSVPVAAENVATIIEQAGAALAAQRDLPGMTAAEQAATRPATAADLAAGVPPVGGTVWPQTWVLADGMGTRVLAKAPLSSLYRTSLMGTIMGKPLPNGAGGGHAADPANGDEISPPLPLRSPALFPIRYSIAGGVVVGTPTILWGDHSFNSDSEVLDFIRRTTRTPEQIAADKAKWDALNQRIKTQNTPAADGTVNVEIEGG